MKLLGVSERSSAFPRGTVAWLAGSDPPLCVTAVCRVKQGREREKREKGEDKRRASEEATAETQGRASWCWRGQRDAPSRSPAARVAGPSPGGAAGGEGEQHARLASPVHASLPSPPSTVTLLALCSSVLPGRLSSSCRFWGTVENTVPNATTLGAHRFQEAAKKPCSNLSACCVPSTAGTRARRSTEPRQAAEDPVKSIPPTRCS